MKTVIATTAAPGAIGPYSQAIEANGFVFVSGQIPLDPATGIALKIFGVYGVHRGKRAHVGEENGGLDHVAERAARAGENGLEVSERLLGLLLHAAGDERAGRGIERDLDSGRLLSEDDT